jgi:hypothetical protein
MAVSLSNGFEAMYSYMASTLSYRVVAICLLSVPFTHLAGLHIRHPHGIPLKGVHGGNRHVLLVCCSYVSVELSKVTAHVCIMLTLVP